MLQSQVLNLKQENIGSEVRAKIAAIAKELEDVGRVVGERLGAVRVRDGLLAVEENAGPKGTHRYRVLMTHSGDAQIAPVQNVHRAKSARGGAKSDTKGVQPIAPEPSIEPSLEPSEEPSGMPRNGDAQTLLAVLYEDVLQIGPPTNYKLAIGQAQTLVKAGSTPDEVRSIAEWLMADPFWSQKGITIGLVLKKRDDWRAAKNAPKPANVTPFQSNGRSKPGAGMSSYDLAAYARELERQGQ